MGNLQRQTECLRGQEFVCEPSEVSSDGAISSVALTDGNVVINSEDAQERDRITGPYSAVAGASSPTPCHPAKLLSFTLLSGFSELCNPPSYRGGFFCVTMFLTPLKCSLGPEEVKEDPPSMGGRV